MEMRNGDSSIKWSEVRKQMDYTCSRQWCSAKWLYISITFLISRQLTVKCRAELTRKMNKVGMKPKWSLGDSHALVVRYVFDRVA